MTRRRLVAAAALLLAALAGHVAYWYAPRVRMLPEPEARLAPLGGDLELLLAYPHQNLGALNERLPDPDGFFAAAARLAGSQAPGLPRLEPFGLPPSSQLRVAQGEGGWAAAVRWYPLPAALARVAGALADNPWLAGGAVDDADATVVSWEGPVWRAAAAESPRAAAVDEPECVDSAVAVVTMRRAREPFPPGSYCLEVEPGAVALRLGGRPVAGAPVDLGGRPGEGLVLVWAAAGEGVLLFDRDSGVFPGLPAVAAWGDADRAEELVPGGRILSGFGRLPTASFGGSTLAATDGRALAAAESWLAAHAGLGVDSSSLAVDVGAAAERTRALASALEKLLRVIGSPEGRPWQDAATVLSALPDGSRLDARIAGGDAEIVLREAALPR